jgi:pimeloyl-ACP methyl ester carboxylesterase
MWSTCSDPARRAPARPVSALSALSLLSLLLLPAACVTYPRPKITRPPLPLQEQVLARYALPGPVHEDYLVPIDRQGRTFRGSLTCGSERCDFQLMLPRRTRAGGEPPPLVLCVPILAGGKSLMWFLASALSERGYAVAWTRRAGRAMRRGQRSSDLEMLFRRTLRQNRMVLAWGRQQHDLLSPQQAVFGVSMGGVVGSVLLALEPDLNAGVLCLAGGDLADIIQHTTEDRVVKWRQWRQQHDGLGPSQLAREVERELLTEPLRFGPHVASDKVLLVATSLDEVVPMRNQDLLWESLGRPQRLVVPLSHYTAALAFGRIMTYADRFLAPRLAAPAKPMAATPTNPEPGVGLSQEPR